MIRDDPPLHLLVGVGLLLASWAPARRMEPQAAATTDTALIASEIRGFLERAAIPGAAVAVVTPQGPIWLAGFGRADGRGTPVDVHHGFYLGSTTKTMTALGVLRLSDRGLLDLDAPVGQYLPERIRIDPPDRWRRLTARHLLTHSSGLRTISAFDRRMQWEGRFDHLEFADDPGRRIRYSSLNFVLLGALVEAVSGEPYEAYMRDALFQPLGMDDTFADRERAEPALVQGHTHFFGWALPRQEPPYPRRMVPTGYVVSSARDVARFLQLHLRGGEVEGTRILSESAVAELLTPHGGGGTGVGLAWGIGSRDHGPVASHEGMTPGFYAVFRILPEEELALAVLTNRNAGPFTPAPVALADMVESHFLGEGVEAPRAWGRWIHMALLAMVLLDLVRTVRLVRRWGSLGRPGALARSPGVILRLVFDLVVVVAVPIWILRGFARITLRGMWEFYPDLALALVLVPALGIPAGILRALVASRSDDAGDASGQDSPPSSPDPSSPGTARATA